jgi:adenylate kinase
MRLILHGPPGGGKGTQAKLLCSRNGLEHISTGDLLRDAIRKGTPNGLRVKPLVEAGKLVPDDLVNALIAERFDRPDRPSGFIMDGYPRTLAQATAFDQVLSKYDLGLTAVVLLAVDEKEILERITGRLTCPNKDCKATYHVRTNPPRVAGICDVCGTKLEQRRDDSPATVQARLQAYHRETEELIPNYRDKGLLREVCGQGDIETIYQKIMAVLQPQVGSSC